MGRLTEIFFTAHPSCATQQKPRPSPPRKGRGFVCHSHRHVLSPERTFAPLPLHFDSPTRYNRPARTFPRANVSMHSRSGKGAFVGAPVSDASSAKALPSKRFPVGLPRPASHPLDDSPVTLRAQHIAENFTCPLTHHCSIHSAYEAVHRLDFSLAAPECVLGLSNPHFLARARVRQFRKKPSLLHLPSQTIENK